MRYVVGLFVIVLFQFSVPRPAQAIIFLPALILIPIAKIVAVVIAVFTIPAAGLGAFWGKLSHKSVIKTVLKALLILLLLAFCLGFFLRIMLPERPLF